MFAFTLKQIVSKYYFMRKCSQGFLKTVFSCVQQKSFHNHDIENPFKIVENKDLALTVIYMTLI